MVEVVVNPVIWTIATATIAVGVSPSSVRKLKKKPLEIVDLGASNDK